MVLELIFRKFREWDLAAAKRVHNFAAVSGWIADWVRCAYQRQPTVIYPPVQIERFSPAAQRDEYFLSICRLVPHKRVDLLVEAFNRLGLPLLVVGEGPQRKKLEQRARENIRFLGFQPDSVIEDLLSRARAYLCAGKEDFGIAMVEAQAAGCPVIALRAGGALEIVTESETGFFFDESTPESLISAVQQFNRSSMFSDRCVLSASRFDKKRFQQKFETFVTASGQDRSQNN